jgi:hypothetical protein
VIEVLVEANIAEQLAQANCMVMKRMQTIALAELYFQVPTQLSTLQRLGTAEPVSLQSPDIGVRLSRTRFTMRLALFSSQFLL